MYNYKDIWNPVWSVVGETLNCKCKVKNPQGLYAISLRNMALQLAVYYVSSHASVPYFLIRQGGVIEPTLLAHNSTDSQDFPQGGLG